jgi:hypothetical protein
MLFDIVLIYIMCVPFAALIVEWELMMQMQNVLFIARQLKNAPLARVSFLSSAVEILILLANNNLCRTLVCDPNHSLLFRNAV